MKDMIALPVTILFATAIAAGVIGCNTTRGLGQDIEAAGEGIDEVAEETEDELED